MDFFVFLCKYPEAPAAGLRLTPRENKKMRPTLLLLLSFFFFRCYAQQPVDSTHCDCASALSIPVYKSHHHIAPKGHGAVVEFERNGMQNPKYFDKEHNTIWYSFVIPNDGMLTFDIIPDTVKDDYDFILFKQGGRGTCDSIRDKTLAPVRANISHNAARTRSLTGLDSNAHYEFNQPGIHDHYSKALPVKSGERYLLVLDNVYEKGKGHTIRFHFNFQIQGYVVDSATNIPLHASVVLTDLKTMKVIITVSSDSLSRGLFTLPIVPQDTIRWSIGFGAPGYFNETVIITQNSLGTFLQRPRTIKLRRIIKDKSFALKDINFFPNKDILKPTSLPALQNLLNVMQENPTLKIRIEGHTNFDPTVTKEYDLKLSQMRAEAVKKFLVDSGVADIRIRTSGYGSTRMIYPFPRTSDQQQANMRVEIKIEEF